MAPATILLMRHAEKPADRRDPNLSASGWQRAERLAGFVPGLIGRPDLLFAAADKPASHRPRLTLEPLAAATGLTVDASVSDKDSAAFAAALLVARRFDGARVVVAWRHDALPGLARGLGAKAGACPDPWPEDLYRLILRLDLGDGAGASTTAIEMPF